MNTAVVLEWFGASIGLIATVLAMRGNPYMLVVMVGGVVCLVLALVDTQQALDA